MGEMKKDGKIWGKNVGIVRKIYQWK